jgi:hypothetical protein
MKPIMQTLAFARETKNTFRFEAAEAHEGQSIDALYIHKSAFGTDRPPTHISVTIKQDAEVAEKIIAPFSREEGRPA